MGQKHGNLFVLVPPALSGGSQWSGWDLRARGDPSICLKPEATSCSWAFSIWAWAILSWTISNLMFWLFSPGIGHPESQRSTAWICQSVPKHWATGAYRAHAVCDPQGWVLWDWRSSLCDRRGFWLKHHKKSNHDSHVHLSLSHCRCGEIHLPKLPRPQTGFGMLDKDCHLDIFGGSFCTTFLGFLLLLFLDCGLPFLAQGARGPCRQLDECESSCCWMDLALFCSGPAQVEPPCFHQAGYRPIGPWLALIWLDGLKCVYLLQIIFVGRCKK